MEVGQSMDGEGQIDATLEPHGQQEQGEGQSELVDEHLGLSSAHAMELEAGVDNEQEQINVEFGPVVAENLEERVDETDEPSDS